jgi:hypothetical protein
MGRMMKHQMEHCETKIRSIQWQLIGKKPQCRTVSVKGNKIVEGHLDGSRKITTALLNKAFVRYQSTHATVQYCNMSIGDAIGEEMLAADNSKATKKYEKELVAYREREMKVNAHAAKCVDHIILGGEEVALKMIEGFAKMKL